MSQKFYLAIDAGGTFFKHAVLDENGVYATAIGKQPVNSIGTAAEVFSAFEAVIQGAAERFDIGAIGISIPGPFDYVAGMSLMDHKFQGIYKTPLRETLCTFCGKNVPIEFVSDTNAYVLGEYFPELSKSYQNMIGVTIGTGLGTGIIVDGHILHDGLGGPKELLYLLPFRDGVLEKYVSGKGIVRFYKEITGDETPVTAKDIGDRAEAGDKDCIAAYEALGRALGAGVRPFVEKYGAQCFLVGGQVAKSLVVFGDVLSKELGGIPVLPAQDNEGAALKGLFYNARQGKNHV